MIEDKKKILNFFKSLEFNESEHLYTVNGQKINSSVSKIIKNFVTPFDIHTISLRVAAQTGIPQSEILKSWDEKRDKACEKGTRVHLFGEFYPFNKTLRPADKFEEAVVKFWNDTPAEIIPVMMELRMYHKEYLYAGTADILLYNKKTGTYIIADYKTNENLFKNYKSKKMLGEFSNLLDNNYNHYQLQLSFYQILFEQMGLKVSSRKIIWLKPTGEYELYTTEDYTDILKQYLKNNKGL